MPAPTPITAFGTAYPSLHAAAAAYGLSDSTLRHRLSRTMDIEVSLITPVSGPWEAKFIGLDSRAYYPAPWCESKLVTARQIIDYYRPDLLRAYDEANPTGEFHSLYTSRRKAGETK